MILTRNLIIAKTTLKLCTFVVLKLLFNLIMHFRDSCVVSDEFMNSSFVLGALVEPGTTVTVQCNNARMNDVTFAVCKQGLWIYPLGNCSSKYILQPPSLFSDLVSISKWSHCADKTAILLKACAYFPLTLIVWVSGYHFIKRSFFLL